MALDKYTLKQGSTGPATEMLQAFLNEHFDGGLDEKKFGVFGPKTEAAVNKALKTLGLEETGAFGPNEYAMALAHLAADDARGFAKSDGAGMMKLMREAMASKDDDKPDAM